MTKSENARIDMACSTAEANVAEALRVMKSKPRTGVDLRRLNPLEQAKQALEAQRVMR